MEIDTEAEDFDAAAALEQMKAVAPAEETATVTVEDEETLEETENDRLLLRHSRGCG